MRKILPFLAVLLVFLLPLSSCAPSDGFHTGRPITKEELASISAELFTASDEPEHSASDPEASVEAGDSSHAQESVTAHLNQTVYWAMDGKNYHADRNCHRLLGEFSVKESTRRSAETNGLRPCRDCVKE